MSPVAEDLAVYNGWTEPGPMAQARTKVCNRCTVLVYAVGQKLVHAVMLDGSVRLVQLPLEEQRHLKPMLYRDKPYPVARAARALRRAGKALGITEGAAAILKELS